MLDQLWKMMSDQPEQKQPDMSAGRSWSDAVSLLNRLSNIADARYRGDREFHLYMGADMMCRVTIKRGNSELKGNGPDPWSAAYDLATKAGFVKAEVEKILNQSASV